jgi:hypothetical protein
VDRHVRDLLLWWDSFSVLNTSASFVPLEASFDRVRTYLEGLSLLHPGAVMSSSRFPRSQLRRRRDGVLVMVN